MYAGISIDNGHYQVIFHDEIEFIKTTFRELANSYYDMGERPQYVEEWFIAEIKFDVNEHVDPTGIRLEFTER